MIAYHRAVLKHLRDTYGIRAHIRQGGKHPFVELEHDGAVRRVTLSRSPGDRNALASAAREIRRMLEPTLRSSMEEPMEPVEPTEKPGVDRLEWTGPDGAAPPEDEPRDITGRGWVACYDSNRVLIFCFGADVKDCLSVDTRYAVIAHGDHPSAGWEIRPGGKSARARILPMGKAWKMNFGAGKLPAFRRCAADYTVVDGHVLVSIIAGERIVMTSQPPVVEHREPIPFPAPQPRPASPPPRPAPEPIPAVVIPPRSPAVIESIRAATDAASVPAVSGMFQRDPPHHAQLRAILKGILNAEEHGWELVKVEGTWKWRAEVGVDG